MEQEMSVSATIKDIEADAAKRIKKLLIDRTRKIFNGALPKIRFRMDLHQISHLTQLEIAAIKIAYPKTTTLGGHGRHLLVAYDDLTVANNIDGKTYYLLLMCDGLYTLSTDGVGVVVFDQYGKALYPAPNKYYIVFCDTVLEILSNLDAELQKKVEKRIKNLSLT